MRQEQAMTFDEAMQFQAAFCDGAGAPITAGVCRALAAGLDRSSATGRRVLDWPGDYIADALPLRLVAPYHALFRSGKIAAFDSVEAIRTATVAHDDWISAWLDGPPQTNEPARSATFMAALLVLADRYALPFELLEIGSSAGLNLLIDRYRYDLGGATAGPADSPVLIKPAWRGAGPPVANVHIDSVRGVDIAPIDVTDPAAATRLMAYIWADAPERTARVEAAIRMIDARPIDMAQGDAADWVEARLVEPQAVGTTRVLMHSVVWPYLGEARRSRIIAALDAAGAQATPDTPIAWVRMEWDSGHTPHRIRLKTWPGGEERHLGNAHPHGAWVEWLG
jgi:hypothetical protein